MPFKVMWFLFFHLGTVSLGFYCFISVTIFLLLSSSFYTVKVFSFISSIIMSHIRLHRGLCSSTNICLYFFKLDEVWLMITIQPPAEPSSIFFVSNNLLSLSQDNEEYIIHTWFCKHPCHSHCELCQGVCELTADVTLQLSPPLPLLSMKKELRYTDTLRENEH